MNKQYRFCVKMKIIKHKRKEISSDSSALNLQAGVPVLKSRESSQIFFHRSQCSSLSANGQCRLQRRLELSSRLRRLRILITVSYCKYNLKIKQKFGYPCNVRQVEEPNFQFFDCQCFSFIISALVSSICKILAFVLHYLKRYQQ